MDIRNQIFEANPNCTAVEILSNDLFLLTHKDKNRLILKLNEGDGISSGWLPFNIIEDLGNDTFLLIHHNGTKRFTKLTDKRFIRSRWLAFTTKQNLGNDTFLLTYNGHSKSLIKANENCFVTSDSSKTIDDLGDGIFLLTHFNGKKQFINIKAKEFLSSGWFEFESYVNSNGNFICKSEFGTTATLNENLKLSQWRY